MADEALYVAVTGDVIGSSQLPASEQRSLRPRFLKLVRETNRGFAGDVVVPFAVTVGDEFQGLMQSLPATLRLAGFWLGRFYPHMIRLGIGYGSLSTPVGASTALMDGECFRRSRRALEAAERADLLVNYETGDTLLDLAVNSILRLVAVLQRDWSPLQHRRFRLYRELSDLRRVAASEGTATSTIGKSLARAHYRAVLQAEADVARLLSAGFG